MHSLPHSAPYYCYCPTTHPHPHPHPRKLHKQSRTFGRGGAGNILPSPIQTKQPTPPSPVPVPVPVRESRHRPHSSSPSLVTRVFSWIRSLRPRLSSRLSNQNRQGPPISSFPTVGPSDQAFLESLVRYTENASYRGHRGSDPLPSHHSSSKNEHNTHRVVEASASCSLPPRSPNLNRMSYIRSPHPPSSYHSCSYTATSRPHPHANHPSNSWYSSDTDDHSANHDFRTNSRASTHSSLFYRPITTVTRDCPSPTQSRPSKALKKRPEPLKITPARPRATPLPSRVSSAPIRVPSITLSFPSASGECEKFAFPTPPTHLHVIYEPKRSSGHWFAGDSVFVPSGFTQHPRAQAQKTDGWETRMEEGFDDESVSSCQAAEDVDLRSSSVTFFTHDSGTVTSPTIDLPTPSSDTFDFGFNSTVSSHLWGRQAVLKHNLSLDDSHSAPSQSDLSGNTPLHPGLILDDEDAEFIGELESVYSAFADVSMSSAGGPMRLSTVFGMDDTMSDTESVTDPHLHSISVRFPRPTAWMGLTA